ncbi:unnamed protein product [Adineta steineri]|uniref:Uncharacterized protein n=1 Tax=Adineta steineri TaxID=433720 RepID=A0A815GQQ8_9BILA|nr:unnamed protein product [Adineta steineri]CAF1343518.1 unnamed protein product [Adineta steineri]CAF1593909.1 unnamed protein product [Adineta steineri]CAF1593998.1 unnamed protein product [Adineta steineri]
MEQYLNLVWKNYTASLSQNSNENSLDENDDASDLFVNNNLHYNIPFWVGVIVITLLFLSALIATIRYCVYTLCSTQNETEKLTLMPPRSPCISSSAVTTIQRHKRQIPDSISHNLSDDNEILSSSSPEQSHGYQSDISIIPIIRPHTRSHLTSKHSHRTKTDINNHNFASNNKITFSQVSNDFQKKVHDIYVLPVSPALSSTSSSTNIDELTKTGSNTMPIRSRRNLPPTTNIHNESIYHGIKNACFTDSPQIKNRTLPWSHTSTLRHIQPPLEPPPLPPSIPQVQFNDNIKSFAIDSNSDTIHLGFNTNEKNQIKKVIPPPVPCRSQKPSVSSIMSEESTKQSDKTDLQIIIDSSPQDDSSEHTWPKPPESMSTSEIISRPSSISYDHLIPTIIMHENSIGNLFHQYRHNEHSILTESET